MSESGKLGKVVKRIQHFTEHECCTLLSEMLGSFDQDLTAFI